MSDPALHPNTSVILDGHNSRIMDERLWRILASSFFFFLLLPCEESTNFCGEALEILEKQLPEDYYFHLSSNISKDKKVRESEVICRLKAFLTGRTKYENEDFEYLLRHCNFFKTCEKTEPHFLEEPLFMTVKDFKCMIDNGSDECCQKECNENYKHTCMYTSRTTTSATTKTSQSQMQSEPSPTGSPQPAEYTFDTQREMASFSLLGISFFLNIILIIVVIHLMTRIRRHNNNLRNSNGDIDSPL